MEEERERERNITDIPCIHVQKDFFFINPMNSCIKRNPIYSRTTHHCDTYVFSFLVSFLCLSFQTFPALAPHILSLGRPQGRSFVCGRRGATVGGGNGERTEKAFIIFDSHVRFLEPLFKFSGFFELFSLILYGKICPRFIYLYSTSHIVILVNHSPIFPVKSRPNLTACKFTHCSTLIFKPRPRHTLLLLSLLSSVFLIPCLASLNP